MRIAETLVHRLHVFGYVTEPLADVGSATRRGVMLTVVDEHGRKFVLSIISDEDDRTPVNELPTNVLADDPLSRHPGVPASLYMPPRPASNR